MDNILPPDPPPGYHLATREELECLPGESKITTGDGTWLEASRRKGEDVTPSRYRFACPDVAAMDNTATPNPIALPPGHHPATEEELKCLPAWSKCFTASGDWILSECAGDNVASSRLCYACPDAPEEEGKRCIATAQRSRSLPPLDPKGDAGKLKPQLQLLPPVFNVETAKALAIGAARYGPWNWRSNRVEMMTYIGAMRRHLDALLDGEDAAPDSGVHHLGHIAASCAIVLDAARHGTLVDNRPPAPPKP